MNLGSNLFESVHSSLSDSLAAEVIYVQNS